MLIKIDDTTWIDPEKVFAIEVYRSPTLTVPNAINQWDLKIRICVGNREITYDLSFDNEDRVNELVNRILSGVNKYVDCVEG